MRYSLKSKAFSYVSVVAVMSIMMAEIGWAPSAHAGLGIMPDATTSEPSRSWFVYTLNPGDTQEDTAVINNTSNDPIVAIVEGLDAINTSSGGFTLVQSPDENQDLGNWVTFENNTVQIPANQSKTVKFKITVPANASVGQHSGAVTVYEKPADATSGVGLRIRVGARIYVTVPGKVVRNMTFDKVTHAIKDGKLTFEIAARNKSNINIEPALDIALVGLRTIRQTTDSNGQFLPNSKIDFKVDWKRPAPKVGYYRANFVLHTWSAEEILPDGTKNQLPDMTFKYSYGFWVGGRYVAILLVLLLLLWIIYRTVIYWRDKNKFQTKVDVYVVKHGETVMHIAESTGVFPQAIMNFNQLSWPYTLDAGDKLMIPVGRLNPDELFDKIKSQPLPAVWHYWLSYRPSLYYPTAANHKVQPTRLSVKLSKVKRKPARGK
jgi:LysM repeat protein